MKQFLDEKVIICVEFSKPTNEAVGLYDLGEITFIMEEAVKSAKHMEVKALFGFDCVITCDEDMLVMDYVICRGMIRNLLDVTGPEERNFYAVNTLLRALGRN